MFRRPIHRFQWYFSAVFVIAVLIFSVPAATADDFSDDILGVAIKGYDAVAYFTESAAVKGSEEFVHQWNEAEWHFASAENRDLFAADPERYAPKHDGF